MKRVVSIVGPTASGKTGLGIAIAKRLAEAGERAEIVNADAYQMYRGMDIGTAKASAEEQAAVPHHLIDIIEPEDTMTVARFQQLARQTITDLQSRDIRPILVGGSGLYARAAIDDITFPGTDSDVRKRLEEREKTEGAGVLFDELRDKDPEAAARMDPRNPRRTIRALEVIELTGKPYSASLPRYRYVIPSVQIGLDLDRPDLDRRIDLRTKQMYDDGFIKEVERIRPHLGATAVRALGYQQVIDLLDGIWDVNEAFADIAQKTKRLARSRLRRQLPSEREAKYRKSVCWSLVPTGYKEYARWIGGTQNTVEHILECGDVTAIGRVLGGTIFLACHFAPVKIPAGVMS